MRSALARVTWCKLRAVIHRGAVLVTGASSGIGQACALRLDQAGYRVFASALSLEEGAETKRQASSRLEIIVLDITEADSIHRALSTITGAVGETGLRALVNNAGILYCAPLELGSMAAVRQVFEVNVFGQIALTQAFLPLLRQNRSRSCIINIGSLAGRSALPFTSPYNASKFALRALSDTWRLELKRQGIAVVLIEPGMVVTPIWQKSSDGARALAHQWAPEILQRYPFFLSQTDEVAQIARKNGVSPARVAGVVLHALQTKRPRAHYRIGSEARLLLSVEKLPTRLRDWLIARRFSL